MNVEQKETVRKLRLKGLGYIRIAKIVGISVDTVKSHCRRHGLTGDANNKETIPVKPNVGYCRQCAVEVQQTPGRKEKKFCSDRCRMKWWNAHMGILNKKTIYTYICLNCGSEFKVYGNQHRKYCCHECYIKGRFGGKECLHL